MKTKRGMAKVYSSNPYYDLFCEGFLDPRDYLEEGFGADDVEKAIGVVENYILALIEEGTLVVV